MTPAAFEYIREVVYRRSAIVLENGKEYLVESRLMPLVKETGLTSIDELVVRMRADEAAPLSFRVVEAMTTNETSFFRDVHPFDAFKNHILPELAAARASSRTLRGWCAAASTGQEPYSLAMLMAEAPSLAGWSRRLHATDLNAQVIARAKAARYRQLEVNRGLPAAYLTRYFTRQGAEWQLKPEITELVTFAEMNLLHPWTVPAQDFIFLRNVLIYFDVDTKRAMLRKVRQVLRPDGYLVLGGGETTINLDDGFQAVPVGKAVVYRPKG